MFFLAFLLWMFLFFGCFAIYWSAAFPFLYCRRNRRYYRNPSRIVFHRYRPGMMPTETYYYTCCGQEFGGPVPHYCIYDYDLYGYGHLPSFVAATVAGGPVPPYAYIPTYGPAPAYDKAQSGQYSTAQPTAEPAPPYVDPNPTRQTQTTDPSSDGRHVPTQVTTTNGVQVPTQATTSDDRHVATQDTTSDDRHVATQDTTSDGRSVPTQDTTSDGAHVPTQATTSAPGVSLLGSKNSGEQPTNSVA